jgi:hypothetical protein
VGNLPALLMIQPCRPCVSKEAATLFTDEQKENDSLGNGHEQLACGQVTMERKVGRTTACATMPVSGTRGLKEGNRGGGG